MRLTFIQEQTFSAEWRRFKLTDEDLQALEEMINARPNAGVVMSGTGGLRKIRFAPPSWHRGKSGATRVCYVWFVEWDTCGLVTLFAKNEMPNLDAKGKALARKLIEGIRKELEVQHGSQDEEKDKD